MITREQIRDEFTHANERLERIECLLNRLVPPCEPAPCSVEVRLRRIEAALTLIGNFIGRPYPDAIARILRGEKCEIS